MNRLLSNVAAIATAGAPSFLTNALQIWFHMKKGANDMKIAV